MNKSKTFIGIDVSKKTFDAALLHAHDARQIQHRAFTQTPAGYTAFMEWLQQQGAALKEVLICMEHTGIYINGLVNFLCEQQVALWVEMPLRIKKCLGLQRGGNDKVAAVQIAQYSYRYQDQVRLWEPAGRSLERLKQLTIQRDRLVLSLTQLSVPLTELAEAGEEEQSRELAKLQTPVLRALEKSIKKVEAAIDGLVASDSKICEAIQRVSSIKGIGKQTAINLYVYTKGFTQFSSAKQLACYCGVVPFTKTSGTSVRFKTGISPHANRKLKKLLHLCALAAIRFNADMKRFYERKVGEGKNKMSVINAVRNKLIHRIFAVVREGRLYVDKLEMAAA